LICSQKFLINVSCLCFFIRCLNEICKRIEWIKRVFSLWEFASRLLWNCHWFDADYVVAVWRVFSSLRLRYSNVHATRVKWSSRK
jgi:hypothetical protein